MKLNHIRSKVPKISILLSPGLQHHIRVGKIETIWRFLRLLRMSSQEVADVGRLDIGDDLTPEAEVGELLDLELRIELVGALLDPEGGVHEVQNRVALLSVPARSIWLGGDDWRRKREKETGQDAHAGL